MLSRCIGEIAIKCTRSNSKLSSSKWAVPARVPTALPARRLLHGSVQIRNETKSDDGPAPKKKRPSPYRLLQPHSFLAAFAPLHVSGWRVDCLSDSQNGLTETMGKDDLQDRRLRRIYEFPSGKEGWRDLMKFVNAIGEIVEQEDHHPTLLICPASDHPTFASGSHSAGYLIELSTHTHTPLPPVKIIPSESLIDQLKEKEVIKPGITRKDIKLAERVEALYRTNTRGI